MQSNDDWDPTPVTYPKQPALALGPIPGVLPYDGFRNPLTRSNTAKRVSMALATPATKGQRKVYHFESEAEASTALDAMLSPDFYGLEVQLPPITYRSPRGKWAQHHFDQRLTSRDGYRRAVFVRNGSSLARPDVQQEIDALFSAMPRDFADQAIVVNADDYTSAYKGNLRRIWDEFNTPNPEGEQHVIDMARKTNFWLAKELMAACDLARADVWQAVLRLIGRKVIGADWHAVINEHSHIWLSA
ncbi:hypothetical protein [Paracoccus litorisediminis]|uniref:TnsA endonuclease N terminal n=1 Tax=Paracoccus litorisediminis TaxID=2006130 RepID=A0A844HR49_9RHOB|nr:hypothetical protein [Paracoccus litorisediminis]MTH60904.1 hypothetical protein [Paracoccus litorisediminis]